MKKKTFYRGADQSARRRRGTARLFVLGAAFMASTVSGRAAMPAAVADLAALSQTAAATRFNIPAGSIGEVVRGFEAATGLDVTFANEMIAELPSPGIAGLFTPRQALEQMLIGTGVGFVVTETGVTLDLRAAEFIAVGGRIPTVSSPKYTEPLRDIPQTINIIPRAVIQQQGATTLRDVLRNVVGITFQAGEGGVPAGDQLTIRGFSARTDMFIDGVRDFGGYSRDSFNLEQVEVAKGPASAIAGRGSTGGSINQVSKTPHIGHSQDISLGVGNADYKRGTVDVNRQLGESVAFRANVMWTEAGVPGRDVVNSERWGIAPSLAIGVGKETQVTVSHLHLDQDNQPEYGLPWVPANTNPELAAYANRQPPVDRSNYYGLTTRDYEDTKTDVSTAQLDHRFNAKMSLRNLTRYGRNDRDSVITAPRFTAAINTSTAINRQLQSRDMLDTIVANQTTLNARFGTGRVPHSVSAGVEFARETSENFARTAPAAPQADLYNPNPNDPFTGPITRSGASTKGVADSAAAFLFDTVQVGPQWEFTGGLRFDRFDVNSNATAVGGVVTRFNRVDEMVSWRGGAVFKPRPEGSIFLGYATSLNPSAEGLSLSAATVQLDPEKTRNLEFGTKWDVLDGRLSATAAGFRTQKTNARTPGINPGDPPTVLAGEQVVSGAEFGASGRITRQWSVYSGYAFMHSEIEASNTVGETGSALALTPEHTFSFWTTYDLPRGISLGGGANYMDAVFRNATNTTSVPSYLLFNALASYAVNQNLTLRLNGQNLGDEQYVDRIGGGHYIPGPGRQFLLTTDIRF